MLLLNECLLLLYFVIDWIRELLDTLSYTKYWLEILKVRGHLGDLGVGGILIFKWLLQKHRVQWRDLVNEHAKEPSAL